MMGPPELATFEEQRPRLFALAYRLLGSAVDAEDAVQDAFLRWHQADRTVVEEPAAWLARVVTNLCINRLTSTRAQRERYLGPWLPEPVLTHDGALGPLETVEQRDSVSMGVLILLERLSPQERAVFVLREAFGYRHAEIAHVVGIGEDHSRQLYRRAREHLGQQRRRFPADEGRRRRLVQRFLAATLDGDLAGLQQLLTEDVVAWADGGGETTAARRPVVGREKVLRYLLGLATRAEAARVTVEFAEVNGDCAVLLRLAGDLVLVMVPEIVEGRVGALRIVISPAKLTYAAGQLM
ncbi:RNA polymerase sigma-70 factor [Micromonospora coxensis]|uniref:RNA polymerase sigma-70 factor n=1 Tax=Micromonospora coxensis TaxID=356852 RepID=UPI0034410459